MINTTPSTPQNLNANWINSRGTWITNFLIASALKFGFAIVPGVSAEASWTLTNVTYNIVTHPEPFYMINNE
jgi:hypothetical protein